MRTFRSYMFLFVVVVSQSVLAEEGDSTDVKKYTLPPTMSLGFSYPLVVSASLGVLVPFTKGVLLYPNWPALRFDGEVGVGGGSVAAGVFIPIGRYQGVSLKTVRLRTWLLPFNEEANEMFNGVVIEIAQVSIHGGLKFGIGRFVETESKHSGRDSFPLMFIGIGW